MWWCIKSPLSSYALLHLSFPCSTSEGVIQQSFESAWGLSAGEPFWQQQVKKAELSPKQEIVSKPPKHPLAPFILGHRPAHPNLQGTHLPTPLPTPPSSCHPSSGSVMTNPGAGARGEAAIASINLQLPIAAGFLTVMNVGGGMGRGGGG